MTLTISRTHAAAAALLVTLAWRATAAEPAAPASRQVADVNRTTRVSVDWQGQTLRPALANLRQAHGLAVIVDRRLDPSTPLNGHFSAVSVDELVAQAAEIAGGASTRLSDVGYVGPESTARRLRTVAALRLQEAKSLDKPTRDRLLKRQPLAWDDFSVPREILTSLGDEAQLDWDGLAQVPHDLWAAVRTPPLTWVERVTLMLAQFDLSFELAEGVARVVPMPATVAIERRYPGGASAERTAERFRQRAPAAEVELQGDAVIVRARVEDHEVLTAKRGPTRPQSPLAGERRFQLQLNNVPLRQALAALEKRLEISFAFDAAELTAAGVDLERTVSVRVQDATLDELLSALLTPTGLTFRRDDGAAISLVPARAPDGR